MGLSLGKLRHGVLSGGFLQGNPGTDGIPGAKGSAVSGDGGPRGSWHLGDTGRGPWGVGGAQGCGRMLADAGDMRGCGGTLGMLGGH